MAIRCGGTLTISDGEQRADALIAAAPAQSIGGRLGARPARVRLVADPGQRPWRPGRGHWLLARRPVSDPAEIAYRACYGLRRSSLAGPGLGRPDRWHIEECLQRAKGEAGLDHCQVRSWRAWHAHTT